jgi:two-component sensor histidine kinase
MSLAPQDAAGKVELIGPSVSVPPRQATALGMIFQELMSNATKYGALRQRGGVVEVEWKVLGCDRNGGSMVHLSWRERCPHGCVIEGKPGMGTSLVRGFARSELRGSVAMRFSPHGVEHDFSITLDASFEPDPMPKLAA